jgi:hypothetical protein
MPVTINLVLIVELIIAAFVGLGVKALFQLSGRINLMNGRIGRLEMWAEQHETNDFRVHDDVKRQLDLLRSSDVGKG